jgi:hypothetical protein
MIENKESHAALAPAPAVDLPTSRRRTCCDAERASRFFRAPCYTSNQKHPMYLKILITYHVFADKTDVVRKDILPSRFSLPIPANLAYGP